MGRTKSSFVTKVPRKTQNSNFLQTIISVISLSIAAIVNTAKRPFLDIIANGTRSQWLFDTGAQVCCMNVHEFRKIPVNSRPIKLKLDKDLRCASNTQLRVKGAYLMNLTVFGRQIQQTVFVCENLGQPAILGIDAIEKLGLNYSARTKRYFFEEQNFSFPTGKLMALSAHIVPPLSAQPIRVATITAQGQRPVAGLQAVATIQSPISPLLSGGPGLVKTNQLGEVTVMLQNCSPCAINISRGDTLGTLECIQGSHVEQVQINEIQAALSSSHSQLPPQLSDERKRQMLADLNLNVPQSEYNKYLQLIFQNHDVFSKSKFDLGKANHYEHSITLKHKDPLYIKQFKIPDVHRKMLEEQVREWLKLGIIQRSNSKYNSPVFIVPKKEPGSFRFVQDFRQLNQNSLDDKYCMKDVNECIGEIGRAGSTIFSTLDLTSGFWQMPLSKSSQEYTAFTIPGMGQFEWLVSAMGLKSCPGGFQRLVELAMLGLKQVIVYIDDLILHSTNHESHRLGLQQMFDRLRKTGLKVNLKKCNFGSTNVSYLGFRLTPEGILPGLDKLQAVRDAKPPTNVHQVRQFLGLCNFFRAHVRNFSAIANPLNQLTRKESVWRGGILNDKALKAFNELKTALCSEPVVAYPRKDRPYSLIVDAATGNTEQEGGMGAILCQLDEKSNYRVIAYASRALAKHEKNYTPFLLEMMAGVWAMGHFDNHLRGRKFTLFSDHRPLENLATVHKKTLTRLQEAMLEYDFVIKYKSGSEMPADFLSRNVLASIDVFNEDLPKLQQQDKFIMAVRNFIMWGTLPQDKAQQAHVQKVAPECFMENEIVWRRLTRYGAQPRTVLLVPASLTAALVREAHGQMLTGHDGVFKTRERLLQSYYWPNIDADVIQHIRGCRRCQERRTDDRPQPHLLTPLPQCSAINQRVHVDLFGPLKTSDSGKKYVLVMTDAFSKYVEIVATPNKEAETVSLAIFNRWICRFGCPLEIVSDGGKEFVNKISQELYKLIGVKHSSTTAYNPKCNAQVERCNQTVAKYLASFVNSTTLDWELYLAPLAFSYNTSLHRTTKSTPFALTYGEEARIPSFPNPDVQRHYGESPPAEWYQRLQQARQLATQHSMQATARNEKDYNRNAVPTNYVEGQLVWLHEENFLNKNRKLAPKWSGPYKIVKVFTFGAVDIAYKNKIYRVNMARIKPYIHINNQTQEPEERIERQTQQQLQQQQQNQFPTFFPQNRREDSQLQQQQPQLENNEDRGEGEVEMHSRDNIPQRRGRGRPRKILRPPSPQQHIFPERENVMQEVPDPILQEEQTTAAPQLRERRVTRAWARQTGQELHQGINQVQASNTIQWRQAVAEGPPYVCDKYGLPVGSGNAHMQKTLAYKRKALKRMSVTKRNQLLTGDSAFPFDPVAYDLAFNYPQYQEGSEYNNNSDSEGELLEPDFPDNGDGGNNSDSTPEEGEDQQGQDEVRPNQEEQQVQQPTQPTATGATPKFRQYREKEEEFYTPPDTPVVKQKRQRRTESQLLGPQTPTLSRLRSAQRWCPPPPGTSIKSSDNLETTAQPSSSSSSSAQSKSWGARVKGFAKQLAPPSPPGAMGAGLQPRSAAILRPPVLRPSRLFAPGPGIATGIPQPGGQQPRHLTDEFGPSRFPTMKAPDHKQTENRKS